MDVGVRYGLPGRLAIIEPDVEAVWVESRGQGRPDLCDQLPYGHLHVDIEIEQAGDVLSGDDQRVALGQGIIPTRTGRARDAPDISRTLDATED